MNLECTWFSGCSTQFSPLGGSVRLRNVTLGCSLKIDGNSGGENTCQQPATSLSPQASLSTTKNYAEINESWQRTDNVSQCHFPSVHFNHHALSAVVCHQSRLRDFVMTKAQPLPVSDPKVISPSLVVYMKFTFTKWHFIESRAVGGGETFKNQAGNWIYEESLLNIRYSLFIIVHFTG